MAFLAEQVGSNTPKHIFETSYLKIEPFYSNLWYRNVFICNKLMNDIDSWYVGNDCQ